MLRAVAGVSNGGGIPGVKSVGALGSNGAQASSTGVAGEVVLRTVTVPALGPNGGFRITPGWSATNNADTKTVLIRWNGTQIRTAPITSVTNKGDCFVYQNRGVTNAQVGPSAGAGAFGTSSGGPTTLTLDTTVPTTLTFIANAAAAIAGDTIALEAYLVEVWT